MAFRRRFGGFKRGGFRRRKLKTMWSTAANQRNETEITEWNDDGSLVQSYALLDTQNTLFDTRFSTQNDEISYRRIVGMCRIGMYALTLNGSYEADYRVDYGLCLIPGDYTETGDWAASMTPNPTEPVDEDEKWFFKNSCILSFPQWRNKVFAYQTQDCVPPPPVGISFVNIGVAGTSVCPNAGDWYATTRQGMLSTDGVLPNGSHLDIKTRRRAKYGEKLHLVVAISGPADEDRSFFVDWNLRVLQAKYK